MKLREIYGNFREQEIGLTKSNENRKDYSEVVDPQAVAAQEMERDHKVQKVLEKKRNSFSVLKKDLAWGRVTQRVKALSASDSSVLSLDAAKEGSVNKGAFVTAFVETPTSVELFEKARNVDRRNVEERTFSGGGKAFDFTV